LDGHDKRGLSKGGIGRKGLMAIGKSKAKVYIENAVKTSFFDVAGVEEAKQSYEKSWSF
jgi:cell division protease FtsH